MLNMYRLFLLSILFNCIEFGKTDEVCLNNLNKGSSIKLKDFLLCNYDRYSRPVKNANNQTKISFSLYPIFAEIEEHSNTINVHAWLDLSWIDEFLQWKPEDHDNIKFLRMASDEIWIPDLSDFNRRYSDDFNLEPLSTVVSYKGRVFMAGKIDLKSHCSLDIKYWPNDKHICGSIIGAKSYLGQHLDLVIRNSSVNLKLYKRSNEWKLEQIVMTKMINVFNSSSIVRVYVQCNFIMRRHSLTLIPTVTFPILAIVLINLISYSYHPLELNRLVLIIISIAGHISILQYLAWMVPSNADSPVFVLNFVENSLALSLVSLFILTINRNIISDKSLPIWLDKIRLKVQNNKFSWLLFISQRTSSEDTDEEPIIKSVPRVRKEWLYIVTFFDRVVFFIFLVIYFIFLAIIIF